MVLVYSFVSINALCFVCLFVFAMNLAHFWTEVYEIVSMFGLVLDYCHKTQDISLSSCPPLQVWCGSWLTAPTASSSLSPPAVLTLSTTSGRLQAVVPKWKKKKRKINSALFNFLFIVLLRAAAHRTCQCLGGVTSGELSI